MPMGSKVQVIGHLRRIRGKTYKVKNYIRKKRPMGKRVKRFVAVGTLEIGHDKYGNIIDNRVMLAKPRKIVTKARKRQRLNPEYELKADLQETVDRWSQTPNKSRAGLKREIRKLKPEFKRFVKSEAARPE